MTKFSLGDFAINQEVGDSQSDKALSLDEFKTKSDSLILEEDSKPEGVENFIPVQKNEDGSLKYSFDNIYKNKQLVSVAKINLYLIELGIKLIPTKWVKNFCTLQVKI